MIMPTLGLDMEEAVIEKWLKNEGESVAKDEPLLIVETEKAATEIVAPASGVLRQIVQPAGATVPVTHTIAIIETEGSEAAAVPASAAQSPAAAQAAPPSVIAEQRKDEER
ncbi:MAG TPA: lipoyl domain-containing protein, partial [Chloroflexota bacterium]|nr:lipoyl domain-containing protein [Chloroflexota bacterium]